MSQRVKITSEMIERSEQNHGFSPYRRWIPSDGMWIVQTASHADRVGGRDIRVEWDPHDRRIPMTQAEKAEHCPVETARQVAEENPQLAKMADEWAEHMKAQQRADTEVTMKHWGSIAEEAQRRADSAACGIETNQRPAVCSDEQEAACQWGLAGKTDLTQAQRLNIRPSKCPRVLLQIEKRREVGQADRFAARARTAGMPEEYIDKFSSGAEPQRRPAFVAAQKFRDSATAKILVLLGTNQCGKSYAASRILWWQENGLFVTHSALRMAIMPGDETGLERKSFGAQFLVLDNVENSMTPALRQRYEEIVINFKDNRKRLVITTTMDPARFLESMKTPSAETGPAFARLKLGIVDGSVMMVECPQWAG